MRKRNDASAVRIAGIDFYVGMVRKIGEKLTDKEPHPAYVEEKLTAIEYGIDELGMLHLTFHWRIGEALAIAEEVIARNNWLLFKSVVEYDPR